MRLRLRIAIIVALFLLNAQAVLPAANQPNSAEKIPTQMEMNTEAEDSFHQADTDLNKAYKELMAAIEKCEEDSGPWKEKLRTAQRDWVKFRDSECEYESVDIEGGQAWSMEYNGCRSSLTQERTKNLRDKLEHFKELHSCH